MKIFITFFQIAKNQVKWENLMSLSTANNSASVVTLESLLRQCLTVDRLILA